MAWIGPPPGRERASRRPAAQERDDGINRCHNLSIQISSDIIILCMGVEYIYEGGDSVRTALLHNCFGDFVWLAYS